MCRLILPLNKFSTTIKLTLMQDTPGKIALFNEIANHIQDNFVSNGEPAHKRRRVDVAQPSTNTNGNKPSATVETNAADEPVELEIKEISVSVPQRKKFELCFTANHLYARAPKTTVPIPAITYAWKNIGMQYASSSHRLLLIFLRVRILPPSTRKNSGST